MQRMSLNTEKSQGFTIVELLIVIVVVAILAAISIVSYQGITQRAAVASMQSDLRGAATALEMHYARTGEYPANLAAMDATVEASQKNTFSYGVSDGGYCLSVSSSATTEKLKYSNTNQQIASGDCQTATLVEWDTGTPSTAGATTTGTVTVTNQGAYALASFSQNAVADYMAFTIDDTPQFTARMYLHAPSSWAASSVSMFRSYSVGGSPTTRVNLAGSGNPGQLRWLRSSNVQVAATSNNAMMLGSVYRVEIQVDTVGGRLRGALFALGSDSPMYDSGWITGDVGGVGKQLRFGKIDATAGMPSLSISRVKVVGSIDSWVGRHSSD